MSLGFNCPNKSHPDYVRLVEQYGEVEAAMMWAASEGEIPSEKDIIENKSFNNSLRKSAMENHLRKKFGKLYNNVEIVNGLGEDFGVNDLLAQDKLLIKFNIQDPFAKDYLSKFSLPKKESEIKSADEMYQLAKGIYNPDISQFLFTTFTREQKKQLLIEENADPNDENNYNDRIFEELIKNINTGRKQRLSAWVNFFEENELVKNNPFIKLYLWNSVTKGISLDTKNIKNISPFLNKAVLESLLNKYGSEEKIPSFKNFIKEYSTESHKHNSKSDNFYKSNITSLSSNYEWIYIPSKKQDSKNFDANVGKLQLLSYDGSAGDFEYDGRQWCTKTYNAEPYLSEGGFYLLIENSDSEKETSANTKLAIRISDVGGIHEIQGHRNNRTVLKMYKPYIDELFLQPDDSSIHKKNNNVHNTKKSYNDYKVEYEIRSLTEDFPTHAGKNIKKYLLENYGIFDIENISDDKKEKVLNDYPDLNKLWYDSLKISDDKLHIEISNKEYNPELNYTESYLYHSYFRSLKKSEKVRVLKKFFAADLKKEDYSFLLEIYDLDNELSNNSDDYGYYYNEYYNLEEPIPQNSFANIFYTIVRDLWRDSSNHFFDKKLSGNLGAKIFNRDRSATTVSTDLFDELLKNFYKNKNLLGDLKVVSPKGNVIDENIINSLLDLGRGRNNRFYESVSEREILIKKYPFYKKTRLYNDGFKYGEYALTNLNPEMLDIDYLAMRLNDDSFYESHPTGMDVRISKEDHHKLYNLGFLDYYYDEYEYLSKENSNKTKGSFNPITGNVKLSSSAINSTDDLERTFLHEVIGHKGVETLLQDKELEEYQNIILSFENVAKTKSLEALKRAGYDSVEDLANNYFFDTTTKEGRVSLVKELIARIAEDEKMSNQSWFGELLTKLKEFLNKVFSLKISENDLRTFLSKARYAAENFEYKQNSFSGSSLFSKDSDDSMTWVENGGYLNKETLKKSETVYKEVENFDNITFKNTEIASKSLENVEEQKKLNKVIEVKLSQLLVNYLKPFGITFESVKRLNEFGYDNRYIVDTLSKLAKYENTENADDNIVDASGHLIFELIGRNSSFGKLIIDKIKRGEATIKTTKTLDFDGEIIETVSSVNPFLEAKKELANDSAYKNPDGSLNEDKVAIYVAGKLISKALKKNYEKGDTFLEMLYEKVSSFLKSIFGSRNIDNIKDELKEASKLGLAGFVKLEDMKANLNSLTLQDLTDYISASVLLNKEEFLDISIPENYVHHDFEQSVKESEELNYIHSILKNDERFGLTGSVAFRKAGTVYRPSDEIVHDIDYVVSKDLIDNYDEVIKGYFPNAVLYHGKWADTNAKACTVTYLIPIGKDAKFKSYDTIEKDYVDSNGEKDFILDNIIMESENDKFIAVDFFIPMPQKTNEKIEDGVVRWDFPFLAKINYARAKDLKDFRNFKLFNQNENSAKFQQNEYIFGNKNLLKQEFSDTRLNAFKPLLQALSIQPTITTSASKSLFLGNSINESALLTQEIGLDELIPLFLQKIGSLSANREVLAKHNLSLQGDLNFEQVQAIIDKDSKLKQFLLKEVIKILSNQYPDKTIDEYTLLRDLIGNHNNIKYYTSSESKVYNGDTNFSSTAPLAGSLTREQQTAEQLKISERFAQDANLLDKNQEIIEIPVDQLNRKLIKDFKELTKGTKSLARYKLAKPDKYGKIFISNRTTDYQKVLSNRGKTDAEVAFREAKDSRQAEIGTELHKIQELFVTNNMTTQDDFLYEQIIKRLPGRERIDIDGMADLAFAEMTKSDNYQETKKKFLDPKTSVFEKPKKAGDQGPSNMYDSITKSLLKDYISIIIKQVEKDWALNKDKAPEERKWNRVNIFVENFVYDENADIGSSVDFIAIFSDGDYGILDHKFMTGIYSGGLDEFGQPLGYSLDVDKQRESYTKTKKEKTYEHQLTSYSDILRGKYGAKNLIFARVKPYYIKYTTNKDKKVDKDSRIASIVTSENAYGNIPISSERTGNKDLDMFLDKIKAQIDAISKDLDSRKAWNSDFITLNRFTELKNIMTSIQVGGDLSLYTKYATTFVKHVSETIETSPENYDLETINTVADEIEFINYFLDNTNTIMKEYKDKFPDQYEEFTKTISDIFIRLKEINGVVEALRVDRVMAEANRLGISKDVFMSFKTSTDISWLQAQTLGIKSQNNSLFQTLSRRNEELNAERIIFQRRIAQEHGKYQEALAKWAAGRGLSGSKMYEPILTEEGDLITPYTKDFYMEQSQRKDLSDRENAKWWEDNFHRSDKRVNGRLSDEERFQKARASYLDKIQTAAKLKSEDSREKYVEDTMKIWDRKNDINHPEFIGWAETYFKSPKNPEKFYNEKYKYMIQPENKPLRDYYEYLIAMNNEMREMVGGDIDVNYNFVPYVAKDMVDRMAQDGLGMVGIATDYWNSITQGYTPNDTTKVERKGAEKEIPIMFVDFIPKDKRSMDLGKNLMMFATFINQYKHVKEMSKLGKSLRYLAVHTPLVVKDSKGNKVLNPSSESGFEAEAKGESSNLVKLFDDMQNHYVYGVTTKSDGLAETIGETNVKIIGKLQSHASAMAMSFNLRSATVGHLAARSQIMAIAEGGKYFTIEQFKKANAVMAQFDAKLMWLSMYFEPDGESENTVKKANELSANALVKKFGENPSYWFQRYADKADEKIILHAMLNNFGIDPVTGTMERLARLKQKYPDIEFKSIYDSVEAVDESDKSKGFRIVNQHTGKDIDFTGSKDKTPEEEGIRAINLNTFMSVRRKVMEMNSKVKGAVTKENIAAFNLSVAGRILGQFRRWMPPTINERLKKEQYNMTMEEFEVGRWIAFTNIAKGNYLKSVGNMLFALIPIRKHSFDSMVNSPKLREMYEQFIANNPHAKSTISFEEYVEEYRSQLKILAKEIKFYGALFAAGMAMYLLYGLDDEEDGFIVGSINSLIEKLSLEVGFFIPIAGTGEAYSMLSKDPFPILKAAKDVSGVVTNGLDELKDFAVTGDDSGKDKTPFGYYTAKFLGLGNVARYTGLTDATKKEDTLYEWLFGDNEHHRQ